MMMTALLSGFLGFTAGSFFSIFPKPDSDVKTLILQQPGVNIKEVFTSIHTTFTYNRTFGADPEVDTATAEAWDSIVPLGQGTVQFPPHSAQFHTLSVVHQLHCLWALHHSYYTALHRGNGGEDTALGHVRHCFDYLRQSLTCAADMTLEPIDHTLGGVTGWGNPRLCRDYSAVAAWAREHRANNLKGFSHE
ncbi:hypothetical protein M406DRAFT_355532 [Cryphonectria parasitica EP155]|uniref:Oxidase ustYa n=1 Tax=Cryphonectria parasitica (strain ATCC 38755 / EP155) TaxID=660469 RepID=A0A9P5CRP5_CRYP1|nr:uncharacterized protein M406DRAFT_355532 [Cryphonectria parasitica EP155]KAF3767315.1 hypothetical protein M406DRAFT_355532 [Cryphonectria parasitica EP155]